MTSPPCSMQRYLRCLKRRRRRDIRSLDPLPPSDVLVPPCSLHRPVGCDPEYIDVSGGTRKRADGTVCEGASRGCDAKWLLPLPASDVLIPPCGLHRPVRCDPEHID